MFFIYSMKIQYAFYINEQDYFKESDLFEVYSLCRYLIVSIKIFEIDRL